MALKCGKQKSAPLNSLGSPNAIAVIPAALAASIPAEASSKTTQAFGLTFYAVLPFKNTSGWGLPFFT